MLTNEVAIHIKIVRRGLKAFGRITKHRIVVLRLLQHPLPFNDNALFGVKGNQIKNQLAFGCFCWNFDRQHLKHGVNFRQRLFTKCVDTNGLGQWRQWRALLFGLRVLSLISLQLISIIIFNNCSILLVCGF